MSYTPPLGSAVDFASAGVGYAAPSGAAVNFPSNIGPTGSLSATLPITGEIAATYTIPTFTAALAATLAVAGEVQAVQATVAALAATLAIAGAAAASHPRYRLHGQVLDGGVLVTAARRVRAHKRSNGAVIGEADTSAGVFEITAGFALDEFYIVAIDLSTDAVDWAPPCANRVLSVLAAD